MVLLALMASPVLIGRIYVFNDLGDFHLPLRAWYAERLGLQEPFLWTPKLFCGYYLAGEGQVGMFHPFHLLIYSTLPLMLAFAVETLASYPFAFVGTYYLLRRRLHQRNAALFGAMLFTFCSFNMLHFVHVNAVAVAAHIPWLLWTLDVLLTDADRRRVLAAQVGMALLIASQLLLGYPQYVWFSLLAEAGYLAFLLRERAHAAEGESLPRAVLVRRGVRLALAGLTGLLLGGIQILPTLDVLRDSTRCGVSSEFTEWGSLHPLNLLQWVAPYLFNTRVFGRNTQELGIYLGAVPLVLVLWSLAQPKESRRLRRLYWSTFAFAALMLWLALGKYGLIYRLQRLLPGVGGFRCPCRYSLLFQFAVAVLAAVAFLLLVRRQERNEKAAWSELKLLALPAVISLATVISPWLFPAWPYFSSLQALWFSPLLMGTAAVLVGFAARGARWALTAMILLTAADLGLYGLKHSVLRDAENIHVYINQANAPQNRPEGRVLMNPEPVGERGMHYGNAMLLAGWSRADGYTGLEASRRLDYRQLAALRAAGVHWVLKNERTASLTGLTPQGDWLLVPDPRPRIYLVSRAHASRDPARDITQIPLETTALVDVPLQLPAGSPGIATLYDDRPGRLRIWADCPSRQLLVVSERYHPGWQAELDGQPCALLRVNGDFMGCAVPPGKHRVALAFHPRSFRNGVLVTAVGLVLLSIALVELARRSAERVGRRKKS
jgi:hypothetical protein